MIPIQIVLNLGSYGDFLMTENAQAPVTPAQTSTPGMRGEIAQKWPKLTAQDVAALKSKEDLITEVQSKYALDKAQARRDVDTFAKGRQL
jgi:hypothetical protein